jgi:hypothetical protein
MKAPDAGIRNGSHSPRSSVRCEETIQTMGCRMEASLIRDGTVIQASVPPRDGELAASSLCAAVAGTPTPSRSASW